MLPETLRSVMVCLCLETMVTFVQGRLIDDCISGGSRVAFSAALNKNTNLGTGEYVIYNQVLLNEGGAYNSRTGIFTAPEAGIYHFNFHLLSNKTRRTGLNLHHNHRVTVSAYSWDRADYGAGSNTVNLKLAVNDKVYVKSRQLAHLHSYPESYFCTFSGFLIR